MSHPPDDNGICHAASARRRVRLILFAGDGMPLCTVQPALSPTRQVKTPAGGESAYGEDRQSGDGSEPPMFLKRLSIQAAIVLEAKPLYY